MSSVALGAGAVLLAYLLGSIPFGLLLARARGVDIRQRGSGNIGATNVARNLGKGLGALVLLLDALKGALPMGLVLWLGPALALAPLTAVAVGWAAVAGHCFSPWLRLRGGKGVATSLGVLVVADPWIILGCVAVFAVVVAARRWVSLGSLAAAASFPLLAALLGRPAELVALGAGAAAIVVVQHRENIGRLVRGTESKL